MDTDTDDPILLTRVDHVAILTLNRPATRNALSGDDCFAAFERIVETLNADLSVRAAILTGNGSAFSSGGNIVEMRDRSGMFAGSESELVERYRNGIQRIPRALQRLQVPIIAAVNGPAMGAGCDLACMCDIRVASTAARFAESFVKVGIVPGDGGCWFLPRIVGAARAAEMTFTGDTLDADEAFRIGLVSRVVEPDQLMAAAMAVANRIATNPPQVLRWTKQLLQHARHATLDEALDFAGRFQGRAHHTRDHEEAVASFFERRPAVFTGR